MELKDQIRQQVREQIQENVNQKQQLNEMSMGGALTRIGGTAAGVGGAITGTSYAVTNAATAAVAAKFGIGLTFSSFFLPIIAGVAGIVASGFLMASLFDLAKKMDDNELRRNAERLNEVIQERDKLVIKIADAMGAEDSDLSPRELAKNADDSAKVSRMKYEVKKLTAEQKRLARDVKSEVDEYTRDQNLSERDMQKIYKSLENAERGLLSTLVED